MVMQAMHNGVNKDNGPVISVKSMETAVLLCKYFNQQKTLLTGKGYQVKKLGFQEVLEFDICWNMNFVFSLSVVVSE
jgi:hypothetical protein